MKQVNSISTLILKTLRQEVLSGRYSSDRRFPSENFLARRFEVSRTLIAGVVVALEKEGLLVRQQGRGTFVSRCGACRKLGLILPGVSAVPEFFQPIVCEINQLAREHDYQLLFADMPKLYDESCLKTVRDLAATFVREKVAGVLFEPLANPIGCELNARILSLFERAKIPVVLLDSDIVPYPAHGPYDVVGVNDVLAGAVIARHLLDMGARKIHILREAMNPVTFDNRIYGVEAELRRAGIALDGRHVLHASAGDEAAFRRHWRRNRPDAFICCSDMIAAELHKTMETVGVRVPDDVLLTGFADLPVARMTTPSITTVSQPWRRIAIAAFERLLSRLSCADQAPMDVFLPIKLIPRGSTRRDGERNRA